MFRSVTEARKNCGADGQPPGECCHDMQVISCNALCSAGPYLYPQVSGMLAAFALGRSDLRAGAKVVLSVYDMGYGM